MNLANKADPKLGLKPGTHVFYTIDGKTQTWATIVEVNKDGTLHLNVHDDGGRIVGGELACKPADGMNHSVPKTWWT